MSSAPNRQLFGQNAMNSAGRRKLMPIAKNYSRAYLLGGSEADLA